MTSASLRRALAPPRVELHLHLEGSIRRRRLQTFWDRPGRDPSLPSDPASLFHHRDFPEFLRHFAAMTRSIRFPRDLGQITADLSRSLRRQGIVAAEVFFSPVIFTRRGLPFLEMIDAITEAAESGRRTGGPRLSFLLDGVRQWGRKGMEENLECAFRAGGRVLGIGLGGDERSVGAGEFSDLFAEARRQGLRTVAHAGEFDSAASVRSAVETLGAERIGHGIRAAEDPAVLRLLRRRRIPLEVCPTSNLRTGVVERWKDHPLPVLVRAGVRVTLNSDDPSLFGTSLAAEYRIARRLGLSLRSLARIRREAIRASFLPDAEKRSLLRSGRLGSGRNAGEKVARGSVRATPRGGERTPVLG